MRFLDPQIYVRFNSPDDKVSLAAHDEFDQAEDAARAHWSSIKSALPASVVAFAEQLMLHDALTVGPAWEKAPGDGDQGSVVLIAHMFGTLDPQYEKLLVFLRYEAAGAPRVEVPVHSDVFSSVQSLWLWDEFDLGDHGGFVHRILLTDGRVLTISFREFSYTLHPLICPDLLREARRAKLAASA